MEVNVIGEMIGKTMVSAIKSTDRFGADSVVFVDTEGNSYIFDHAQDCCEAVYVEDINGNLDDLVGSPILTAEESTRTQEEGSEPLGKYDESYTWTFYRFSTAKGFVVIRWYGSSNGYYSEAVALRISPKEA